MEEFKKVIWIGIILIAIIGIGFGIYYFFFYGKPEEALLAEKVVEEKPSEVQIEEPDREEAERVLTERELDLDKSDDLVRKFATKVSSHPRTTAWLKNEDLVRRFVAVADNIANGMSPRPHLEFLVPPKKFSVIKEGDSFFLDPDSFSRYNLITEVFASLDTEECVKLYWEFKPLIQEAYLDLGYPTQDFHDTFLKAIVELLKVPVVYEEILLEKKVVTYMMADPKLEELSLAQKHLLRMGGSNVRKIQTKLQELARVLGIPEDQIPQPEVYSPLKKR